jgi:hypothetical protein
VLDQAQKRKGLPAQVLSGPMAMNGYQRREKHRSNKGTNLSPDYDQLKRPN